MAINFDSLVIDRVLNAVAEDFDGNLLYLLNNLSDVKLNVTSESKDKKDAVGTLIKRFFTAKNVEFSAATSLMSFSMLAEQSGNKKEVASREKQITAPKFEFIPAGSSGTHKLQFAPKVEPTKIYAVNANGTLGMAYEKSEMADPTHFTISGQTITLPVLEEGKLPQLFVKYEYDSQKAVKVTNSSDKFPRTVQLTLSVLVADSCDVDTMRHAYVILPSFQLSPDCEITLDTDSTFPFSGVAQVDYCAANKDLYYIILSEDDVA